MNNTLAIVSNSLPLTILKLFLGALFAITGNKINDDLLLEVIQGGLKEPDPQLFKTIGETVQSYGYPFEIHHTNCSNYRLEMHRVPHGIQMPNSSKGIPILMLHGFTASSFMYIAGYPNSSLGYILGDSGFDTWLGNFRGNHYSRYNYKLSPDNPEFWDFSLDEYAEDVSCMIDYILGKTGAKQLFIISHSAGNIATFQLLSTRTEYSSKVKAVAALAVPNSILPIVEFPSIAEETLVDTLSEAMNTIPNLQVKAESTTNDFKIRAINLLNNVLFLLESSLIYGDKVEAFNQDHLTVLRSHMDSSSSLKVMKHFGQAVLGGLRKFNYGPLKNMKIYQQTRPPAYNLSNIEESIYIYYARNDKIADKKGSEKLKGVIPSVEGIFEVGYTYSGHKWLFIGKDAGPFYSQLVSLLNNLLEK